MASIYGQDGGTLVGGRRRPTNAGTWPNGDPAVPRDYSGMPGTPTNPNTGFPGPMSGWPQPPQEFTPQMPQASAPAPDFSRLMGVGADKLNDPTKHDFKYDTMRTLAQFDPRQGFTPDVINALNGLGYGTFSGSGDKLSLSGAKNAKDAADFSNQDWIFAHDANNDATRWNFGGGGAGDAGGDASNPLASLFAGMMQPAQNTQTDLSWLGPLLETLMGKMNTPTTPAPMPTAAPMVAPPIAPSYSQPSPTFSGGYATPGYGGRAVPANSNADATTLLSMALPKLMGNPQLAQDPLIQQIQRLIGGGA